MFEFDIAISFADEDRNIAYELASELKDVYGYKIFYAYFEQAQILGAFLPDFLIDIYKNKARYCIVLISKHFKEKRWTKHEWKAAQTRAMKEPEIDYILPITLDDTEITGLSPEIGALSINKMPLKEISRIINEKISGAIEFVKIIRVAENHYLNNNFQKSLDLINGKEYDNNIEALLIRGYANGGLHKYQEAIHALNSIIIKLPEHFLAQFHLGIYYFRMGDFANAVKHYELAEKLYPNHPTIKDDLPLARKKLSDKMKNINLEKTPYQIFSKNLAAIAHIQQIVNDLDKINIRKSSTKKQYLLSSYIIFLISCWEAFIENTVQGLSKEIASNPKKLQNVLNILKKHLTSEEYLEFVMREITKFNTPKVKQINKLISLTIGFERISDKWSLPNLKNTEILSKIDSIYDIRGDLAHTGYTICQLSFEENYNFMEFFLCLAEQTKDLLGTYQTSLEK